ncbi:MAG: methyltetrahydrofolate cobalamin methyltransferase [Bacillota bacterium]|nr:methyltetrahydrofolate cobalamin methyltransferase [Bacillota bacterium]
MLVVGELINTSRKNIKEAVEAKNAEYIQQIAKDQVEAGADYLDINCGTRVYDEEEIMAWLVDTVREVVQVPLCIDSPNPKALAVGLERAGDSTLMVNSISAEKERFEQVLPLVKKYNTKVVALCMDDAGIPETAEDRLRVSDQLIVDLLAADISQDQIYLDPLIKPLGVNNQFGVEVLDCVRTLSLRYPEIHFICGLSNISFGLPERKLLNRVFMVMNITAGMDGFILDPLDQSIMSMLGAAWTLIGKDDYCMNYLKGVRAGRIKA